MLYVAEEGVGDYFPGVSGIPDQVIGNDAQQGSCGGLTLVFQFVEQKRIFTVLETGSRHHQAGLLTVKAGTG